eukprot:Selendium_serpulae@DN5932_c1_g2_i6.p1
MKLFRTLILPKLLFGCETWTLSQTHSDRLNTFHMKCLRTILGVSLFHHVRNTEIRDRLGEIPISLQVTRKRLQWAGHVERLPHERVQRQLLRSRCLSGRRPPHGVEKRWQDLVAADLKQKHMKLESATDRAAWRNTLHRLANTASQ